MKKKIIAISIAIILAGVLAFTNNINKNLKTNNIQIEQASYTKDNSILGEYSEVHFINTGNSDSILIKCGNKSILIDGGDNDDEQLMVNYLKKQGVTKLDYLISTHPHADHCGGLDAVVENIEVENVFVSNSNSLSKTYTDFINAVANKGLYPSVPLEGAKFNLGNNAYIKFYNTKGGTNLNNSSLVVMFVNGNDKFLFTGDIEKSAELAILDELEDIDVLKVSHHGSKTSSCDEFLDVVNPEYAVILVGENNSYKHPHKATMDKLLDREISVFRTDECQDIVFKSNGSGIEVNSKLGSYNYRD